jgi:hypothetical protein
MTYIITILRSLYSFYPLLAAFWRLPKLETWKDKEAFYVYLVTLINSDFLRILTEKTPFYLDDSALQQLQLHIKNRTIYDIVYSIMQESADGNVLIIPSNVKEVWNFVNTVFSVRSLL